MSSPCETEDCLDAATLAKFNWFKWLVPLLGLLVCLPVMWWLGGRNASTSAALNAAATTAPTATLAAAEVEPEAAPATEEAEVAGSTGAETQPALAIAPLSLNSPNVGEFALGAGGLAIGPLALSGSGQPGAALQIAAGETVLGETEVGADGSWAFDGELELAPGTYDLAVTMLDTEGTTLDEATAQIVVPEVAPEVTELRVSDPELADFAPAATGGLLTGAIGLTGSGEPGAQLEIMRDGEAVGKVTIDDGGNWSFAEEVELAPGTYEYQARMLDANGNTLAEMSTKAVIAEGEATPAAPTLVLPAAGTAAGEEIELSGAAGPGSDVEILRDGLVVGTVTADGSGQWSYTTQLPAGDYEFTARVTLADGSTLDSGRAALSLAEPGVTGPVILGTNATVTGESLPGFYGEGRSGSTLEILQNGQVVGGATVKVDGTWACRCQLAPGTHTLTIREQGEPATESQPVTLTVESLAPAYDPPRLPPGATPDPNRPKFTCPDPIPQGEVQGTLYKVATCETYGLIAARLGTTVADLIAFNPQVPDPGRIYDGQLLNIPSDASCFDQVE